MTVTFHGLGIYACRGKMWQHTHTTCCRWLPRRSVDDLDHLLQVDVREIVESRLSRIVSPLIPDIGESGVRWFPNRLSAVGWPFF